jgi:heme O synthase-like polyprenyltransferase
MRHPDRKSAMACFHASLAQLSILLVAAMLDSALRA